MDHLVSRYGVSKRQRYAGQSSYPARFIAMLPRIADTPLISPLPFAMPDLGFPLATGVPGKKAGISSTNNIRYLDLDFQRSSFAHWQLAAHGSSTLTEHLHGHPSFIVRSHAFWYAKQ